MKNNKGFSLVELIIVIAIMAILAGAIAPALIRYIDKSRKSNDVSSAKTIKTAVETVMTNEDVYAGLTSANCQIFLAPGATGVAAISGDTTWAAENTGGIGAYKTTLKTELMSNLNNKVPKVKYKKNMDGSNAGKNGTWCVSINVDGTISVGGRDSAGKYVQMVPDAEGTYK